MYRIQHVLPSGLIALIGGWVTWISYTQQPAEAFLFPRLISTCLFLLALVAFGRDVLGLSITGKGVSRSMAKNLFPGLLVSGIYIFWAAKAIGFYVAFSFAFITLLSLYDPASHRQASTWVKRIIITAGVVVVMYGVFAGVLRVYTPRGMFF